MNDETPFYYASNSLAKKVIDKQKKMQMNHHG